MEYYILLLLVGLFHTVSVSSDGDDGCKDQLREMRKEMNDKIDRLETLLYKVLAATNYKEDKQSQFDICTLERKNDCENANVGEIHCDSIDLFAKTSTCKECIAGKWQSVKPCKPYYGTIINESVILENGYINVTIYRNGTLSGEIIENEFGEEGCNCNCTWSKYSYNGTHLSPDKTEKLLLCNECKEEECYCLVESTTSTDPVCFKKKGSCKLKDDNETISCSTDNSGHSFTIIERKCDRMKKQLLKNCSITISIRDEDILSDIVIGNSNKHHWSDGQVQVTCPDSKDILSLSFYEMCENPGFPTSNIFVTDEHHFTFIFQIRTFRGS